ncbi:hypothetical protein AV530_003901 [Patagioenas fasciata monilis]|uniref:Uncharacterized protein n=1 Tax=Patagioenas fasciata monilis TaxID=372326 RepID=A0A1V4KYW9_PATFA|nr:hypothetical protein AV530_003901 [Patagioenas fasciata monilis]
MPFGPASHGPTLARGNSGKSGQEDPSKPSSGTSTPILKPGPHRQHHRGAGSAPAVRGSRRSWAGLRREDGRKGRYSLKGRVCLPSRVLRTCCDARDTPDTASAEQEEVCEQKHRDTKFVRPAQLPCCIWRGEGSISRTETGTGDVSTGRAVLEMQRSFD